MANFLALAAFVAIIAGWVTSVVVAVQAKAWLFMIATTMLAPVAVAHGWSVWLGYPWL